MILNEDNDIDDRMVKGDPSASDWSFTILIVCAFLFFILYLLFLS